MKDVIESGRFSIHESLVDVAHIKKRGSGEELVIHVRYIDELIHLLEVFQQERTK
jgi:hypothetical protein